MVGEAVVEEFAALALAQYDDGGEGVYLFYCDPGWNVVTDALHEDVTAAIHQAIFEFGLLQFEEFAPAK